MILQRTLRIAAYFMITMIVAANPTFQSAMLGKLAYLEQNYQLAQEHLKIALMSVHDEKTYWQYCTSALNTNKFDELHQLVNYRYLHAHTQDEVVFYDQQRYVMAALSGNIQNDCAYKPSTAQWGAFFDKIPAHKKPMFLDKIYTEYWLSDPSIRAFMVETLVAYQLYDDAFELAMCGFEELNSDWIRTCQHVFSYSQQRIIFGVSVAPELSLEVQQHWALAVLPLYTHSEHIPAECLANLKRILKSSGSHENHFIMARSFLRQGHGKLIGGKHSLTTTHSILWEVEKCIASCDWGRARSLISEYQGEKNDPIYRLMNGYLSAQSGLHQEALQWLAISEGDCDHNIKKEIALLKGYVLSQISPKKALNQALND
ncbi:MAG: hypothetical protein FJ161_01265, partial [Gammaproteobacteria bacterium]|nr:hypothetical protein [Gammaproteobacteria bacterium]